MMMDGPMINEFVKNTEAFNKCVDERFKKLDVDEDGVISRNDLLNEGLGRWIRALDDDAHTDEEVKKSYYSIFEKFHVDEINSVNLEKFRLIMKEINLALVRGIGDTPVGMLLNDDSLLLNVCVHKN
ncbi:uncharacterized protein LOC104890918 [Beta vulgaris subsp. vulgaris]|uniref:uncharacterized protein LOC104890918 n=1 Tax=Beta vulgaris subsp. vulgaris TaxID=3555 RepID=UPI002036A1AA|nr:uncharacterized protein LOC104890918 [Beta vulgaris subsp. vulgaris]